MPASSIREQLVHVHPGEEAHNFAISQILDERSSVLVLYSHAIRSVI